MSSDLLGEPRAAPLLAAGPSRRGSPGFGAAAEHDEDDDRDDLDDEGDDAASSEGRARSAEAESAHAAPGADLVSAAASEAARTALPPVGGRTQAAFVHKVWSMVETPALQNLISWAPDGKSFLVFSPEEFARTVLPQFFKHSNFASFLRQLNFYSWSKVNDVLGTTPVTKADGTPVQAWEFRNPNFQRGRPDLLARIKRKTAKSNASASPATTRRRSSVTTLTSLRSSRREAALSAASDAGQSAEEERDVKGSTSAPHTEAPTPVYSSMRQTGRDEYAAAPKRIAAGLADFAPYAGEVASTARIKEENDYPTSSRTSPPQYRHAPPGPPPHQPTAYAAPHQYSPGTGSFGHPSSSSSAYPSYRYSYAEEPLARQVHALEGQVRTLSDALYHSQQESVATRTTSYGVLHTLLGVVANLDPEGRQREELQAASAALAKLSPDASPAYPYQNPFAYSLGGWPAGHPFPSPRPSTSHSASQFYYNRIPVAESYTRTSRPDSRPDPSAPPPQRPATQPAPSASIPAGFAPLQPASAPAMYEPLRPPQPPILPPPRPLSRPRSVGGGPTAYPSPRTSWGQRLDGNGGTGPHNGFGAQSAAGSDAQSGKALTTLPPLSSLLNPAGGAAPSLPFGGERRLFEPTEDGKDRAHKKQRQ